MIHEGEIGEVREPERKHMLGVKQTPLRTRRSWWSGFTLQLLTIIGDIKESAAVFG